MFHLTQKFTNVSRDLVAGFVSWPCFKGHDCGCYTNSCFGPMASTRVLSFFCKSIAAQFLLRKMVLFVTCTTSFLSEGFCHQHCQNTTITGESKDWRGRSKVNWEIFNCQPSTLHCIWVWSLYALDRKGEVWAQARNVYAKSETSAKGWTAWGGHPVSIAIWVPMRVVGLLEWGWVWLALHLELSSKHVGQLGGQSDVFNS